MATCLGGAHPGRFIAQRWRAIHWLSPFCQVQRSVWVLHDKITDRYLSLWKVLFRGKATRLLSPALEQAACGAATEQNYQPGSRALSFWIDTRLGPRLVWACVQYYGARRMMELDKAPPPPAQPRNVPVLISEVDPTWLRAQQRRRKGPVRHFHMHLGLHYTGRQRRYQARGSTSLSLTHNTC